MLNLSFLRALVIRSVPFLFINLSTLAWAGSTNVFLGEQFCSTSPRVCMRGSIEYDYSKGALSLHGRVGQTRHEGVLLIRLKGQSGNTPARGATLKVRIDGKSFDLVKAEVRTSIRERFTDWTIQSVSFRQ